MLRRNTSKQDTGISLRDSLRVYLNTQTCPPDSACRARCDAQLDDSVIGTVGATVIAINAGFTATFMVGAALYLVAGAIGWWLGRVEAA